MKEAEIELESLRVTASLKPSIFIRNIQWNSERQDPKAWQLAAVITCALWSCLFLRGIWAAQHQGLYGPSFMLHRSTSFACLGSSFSTVPIRYPSEGKTWKEEVSSLNYIFHHSRCSKGHNVCSSSLSPLHSKLPWLSCHLSGWITWWYYSNLHWRGAIRPFSGQCLVYHPLHYEHAWLWECFSHCEPWVAEETPLNSVMLGSISPAHS